MSAGALIERLLVQQNTASTNSHGATTPAVWTTLDSLCAELVQTSGNEQLEASRIGSQTLYTFRTYARADVRPAMRALWTPAWPPSATRVIVEIFAVRQDPKDRQFMLMDCGVHDAGGTA
jgi:head-tail adaptor